MLSWRPVDRLSVRYMMQGHWAAWRVIDSFFLRLTIYRGGGRSLSFPAYANDAISGGGLRKKSLVTKSGYSPDSSLEVVSGA